MVKIGVCDDGKNFASFLESTIVEYGKARHILIDVEVWYTGEDLCKYLQYKNNIDILFLDIELVHISGIEVGDYIRNELDNRAMQIIYISGKESYALKLFQMQPLDFLVKPIEKERIFQVLDLAFKLRGEHCGEFKFQYRKEYYQVLWRDILYFESKGRKIKLHTEKGIFEFYDKLSNVLKELPNYFIMIHQSYIVNTEFVKCYKYDSIELQDGTLLNISKKYRQSVRQEILSRI